MLVSHRNAFIFTKTVKTAGTSVECFFEPFCVPEGAYKFLESRGESCADAGIVGYRGAIRDGKTFFNHMSAGAIKNAIGSRLWSSYFKFTVVRNPFDKMLSAYFWFNRNKMPSEMREDDRITDFRDWLEEKTFAEDIDARMVFDRDKYLIDGEIALDYFIRYESLCDGMQFVCERVGVPWRAERLMYLKAGSRPCKIDRHLYYDSVATQKVIQWFDFEFEYFCYPREP